MGKTRQEIEAGKLETLELFRQYRANPSKRIYDKIFELNLPLAHRIANRFAKNIDEPLDDLCQVAGEGLMKAIEKFDPTLGNAFSSYACDKIKGELMHYRRDKCSPGGIRFGRTVIENGPKMQRMVDAGYTLKEIAEAAGVAIADVRGILEANRNRRTTSLDSYRSNDGEEVGLEIPSWDNDSSHWCRVAEALGVKIQRRQDGLINATLICKTYNREFRIYWKRQATKKYLKNFPKRSRPGILYQISRGRSGGAWVSDQIALDLIRWCDPQVGMAIDTFTANSVIESA